MDLEFILNKALNKALCSKKRIKQPNSNEVAKFVSEFIKDEQLILNGVSRSKPREEKQFLENEIINAGSTEVLIEDLKSKKWDDFTQSIEDKTLS